MSKKKQQSGKLFQDENVQIHLVSDLRVLQAGDVSCRFLLQMEGKKIQGRQESLTVQGTW